MNDNISAFLKALPTFTHITADSRQVAAGSLFLAYPGEHRDGRNFIQQAIQRGAVAVLWEQSGYVWNAAWQVANLAVNQLRAMAGSIADVFYGQPSRRLWMIGITGTNGKTSCSHNLAQALSLLSRKTAVIGTLGNGFAERLSVAVNTTPDALALHGMLADFVREQASAVAMEVSSHGLEQGRVNGVHFDVALFTNLSRDHLDYHGDMATYAAAKRKLFAWPDLGSAVINSDDAFGHATIVDLERQGLRVLSYGLHGGDVRGSDLQFNEHGLRMQVVTPYGRAILQAPLLGRFNAYNALAVLTVLLVSDVSLPDAIDALAQIQPVAGRMQRLGGDQHPLVVIDYAHTPDALQQVLTALREQCHGRLICVFGCGGNRDQGKRPLMGAVVAGLADGAVVTTDNPRDENPAEIINAIVAGMQAAPIAPVVEADRTAAIQLALASAQAGDIVLIAGKGHEEYQEVAGIRHAFSDFAVASAALAKPVTLTNKGAPV